MIASAKTKAELGLYHAMPDAEYRALDALSNSDLMAWAKGDEARQIDPRAAVFGTAFHAVVLEPDVAKSKLVCLEPRQKRNSYEGGEDMLVLTNSDYQKLMGCYKSVQEHDTLSKLMELARSNRDRCEIVAVWRDDLTGIMCKAKIDQVTDKAVYDWKTTQGDPDTFGKSISAFGYHVQAAHYLTGARAAGLPGEEFRFACASKRADKGHVCWMQGIDEDMLTAGFKTREMLMKLYSRYAAGATQ